MKSSKAFLTLLIFSVIVIVVAGCNGKNENSQKVTAQSEEQRKEETLKFNQLLNEKGADLQQEINEKLNKYNIVTTGFTSNPNTLVIEVKKANSNEINEIKKIAKNIIQKNNLGNVIIKVNTLKNL